VNDEVNSEDVKELMDSIWKKKKKKKLLLKDMDRKIFEANRHNKGFNKRMLLELEKAGYDGFRLI